MGGPKGGRGSYGKGKGSYSGGRGHFRGGTPPRPSPYQGQARQQDERVYACRVDEHLGKSCRRHFIG